MEKRGISPLIATVLLIGFAIVISSFVFVWGTNLIGYYQEKTERESFGSLECATKIAINIKKACILGNTIKVQIENIGSRDIDSFLFRIKGGATNLYELNKTSSIYSYNKFDAEFDANRLTGIINPNEIDVFPRILIKNKGFTCEGKSISIKPCYLLPRLNTFDDWVIVSGNGFADVVTKDIAKNIGVDEGVGVMLTETNEIEIKSIGFKIPDEVDNFHIRGEINTNGNVKYELKYLDGSLAKTLVDKSSIFNFNTSPTIDITDLRNKDVYFSITVSGSSGGYATLSELCYTNSNYCVI